MMQSVWSENVKLPSFNKLCGNKKTDVLVIGGGLCGILCAYFLEKSGVSYILVEGNKIASGITKNTTAKITSLHGLIYDKLIKSFDKELAQKYLKANEEAVRDYSKLCKNINCDFSKKSAYTYSISDREKIEDEVKAINSLGGMADFCDNTELPFEISGAICVKNQAQFNPLKFIAEISKNLNIFEDTFIRDITPHKAICDNGEIVAKKIIVTTHFPFINKHGSFFLKLYQHRSYVVALENAEKLDGMYVDEDNKGLSFRNFEQYLLLGGGGHRTGKNGGAFNELIDFQKKFYPEATLSYQWATQDCMSLDGIPYIGQYSKMTPDLYVATGFNKWGITSSMVAAKILCDLIMEKENEYADIFSPSRNILTPQLAANCFETLANFMIPTTKRCPHLGCSLKWNKAEHSWDCPCHGSRFDENGKLIDNPATGDAFKN